MRRLIEAYREKLIVSLAYLYVAAYLLFSTSAVFDTELWDIVYFYWQDTAGAGWLVWLSLYLSVNTYRGQILPVFIYSIFIFIWDIISYQTGLGANHPTATGVVFGLAVLIVIFYMITDLRARSK